MKKSFLVAIVLILSGFSIISNAFVNIFAQPNRIFIKSSLINNGIKLYAIGSSHNGVYKQFVLNINGKEKTFNWSGLVNSTWNPYMKIVDINNDHKKELIIFMVLGEGTGFYLNKAHIIELNKMKEFVVEDALKIIKQHVETSVKNNEFEVKIDSKNYIFKYEHGYKENLFKNLFFGDVVNYYIKNNSLVAQVGAEISSEKFIGDIYVKYENINGIYTSKNIYFKPYP